jgi:hypothetical protein
MPYVQLGRMRANGSGLYTTQGVVWMPERSDVIWMDAETSVKVTPLYWAPTVAYRMAGRRSAVHLYVSGALGTMGMRDEFKHPDEPPSPSSAPVRFIMGGISLEHTLGRSSPLAAVREGVAEPLSTWKVTAGSGGAGRPPAGRKQIPQSAPWVPGADRVQGGASFGMTT